MSVTLFIDRCSWSFSCLSIERWLHIFPSSFDLWKNSSLIHIFCPISLIANPYLSTVGIRMLFLLLEFVNHARSNPDSLAIIRSNYIEDLVPMNPRHNPKRWAELLFPDRPQPWHVDLFLWPLTQLQIANQRCDWIGKPDFYLISFRDFAVRQAIFLPRYTGVCNRK